MEVTGGSGFGRDSLGARAIYWPLPKIPDDLRYVAFEAMAVAHFEAFYDGKVNARWRSDCGSAAESDFA
jgi:hypothetical protein